MLDNYPLPLQSEVINALRSKKFITAINATTFFYQFGVYPPHCDRLTVISLRGLKQSKVCLIGYRNSPTYMQRFIDQLLRAYAHFARTFINDIVIYSDSLEDHLGHLETIFGTFCKKNIAIAPTKSFVGYPGVKLLGFHVDSFSLTTTREKVEAFR